MRQPKPKPSAAISGGTEPGFTLHKLRHDDFHEICGLVESVKTMIPDDPTIMWTTDKALFSPGDLVETPEGKGLVTGFAVDVDTLKPSPFARVNGRLFHVDVLKHA